MSRFFRTPAFPAGSGPDYVNAAALLETVLDPEALLAYLHGIEADLGRTRRVRWAERTIDLDIVFHGDSLLPDAATVQTWIDLPADRQRAEAPPGLILPHPRLQDRPFVLIPLADIAPGWRHPLTGTTVAGMVGALSAASKAEIRPV